MAIKVKRAITRTAKGSSSCSMPGVWRAVTYSKGALVIFHSPKACAHVARTMDIGSHFRAEARLADEPYHETVPMLTSLLSEKHSIFGGEKQLEKCIEYAVSTYKPECIVIANSCVAGVIGDDVKSVAQSMEEKYSIPIISVPCSGFLDGEFFAGYYNAIKELVERFMTKQKVEKNSVFLLGDYGGPKGQYAREVKRLLSYFDLRIKGQFPTYMSLAEFNTLPTSSLNIVLGGRKNAAQSVEKVAILLKKRFDTPYYADNYPLGWSNTIKWLEGLGKLLGKEDIAQKAIFSEGERRIGLLEKAKEVLQGKQVVLCLGRRTSYFQPGWVIELFSILGLKLSAVVLLDCYIAKDKEDMLKEVKKYTDVGCYDENQATEMIEQSDLIFTTHELNMLSLRQLYLPMLPEAGVSGELALIEKIIRLFYRRGNKGGIVYG